MKTSVLSALACLPVALLTFTSCSTPNGAEQVVAVDTANGAAVVDTITTTATVTGLDAAKRKVTVKLENGRYTTVKCGSAVVNFNQLQINDRVTITITEELAVFIGKGAPPSAAGVVGVALAPVGAKPGGVMADTVEITAQVTAIDAAKHKVTLALPDGTSKTVKVGKKVDLSGVKLGDNVTVQHTEGVAITVAKA